ncbi:hypothetical protein [Pectobacterium brasiliense]|uniref:hypothetical protein n=1 Tax=Pectobacterium brasiliense TaxID=180957 RepID=UPI0025A3041A|nr:hypothetical protein [Pectobacterium brasiliense]WJM82383.1 hypothetical protein QTI90_06465 [Pectobacterium brasiliense]
MMLRSFIMAVGLCISLVACSSPNVRTPVRWSYGTGSNIDITNNTRTEFYRGGKLIYADREAGGGLLSERITGRWKSNSSHMKLNAGKC